MLEGMDYQGTDPMGDWSSMVNGIDTSGGSASGAWNGYDFSGGGGGGSGWSSQDTMNAINLGGGLYNMFSHSPNSIRGAQEQAAQMAMPFDPRSYGGWIPWASQQEQNTAASSGYNPDLSQLNSDRSAIGAESSAIQGINANLTPINPQIGRMAAGAGVNGAVANAANARVNPAGLNAATGQARLNPVLEALGTNDPSMSFRYQTGLDSLSRGAAATGTLASGKQLAELERYGQGFASQEYQNMFNRQTQLQALLNSTQQQNYSEQLGTFGANLGAQNQYFQNELGYNNLVNATQAQNFNQLVTAQGLTTGREEAQFNQNLQKQSLGLNAINMGANVDEFGLSQQQAAAQINQRAQEDEFNKRVLQMNQSMQLAGVNMSSPATAAQIMNSPYGGAVNQAQTDLGATAHAASGNSTMSGAMQGAELGSIAGPWGALAGGVLGAIFS